jgi:hypothetical protein
LKARVRAAISEEVVPLRLVRKYARICRDYMRGYETGHSGQSLENNRKERKSHRAALDSHYAFINADSSKRDEDDESDNGDSSSASS